MAGSRLCDQARLFMNEWPFEVGNAYGAQPSPHPHIRFISWFRSTAHLTPEFGFCKRGPGRIVKYQSKRAFAMGCSTSHLLGVHSRRDPARPPVEAAMAPLVNPLAPLFFLIYRSIYRDERLVHGLFRPLPLDGGPLLRPPLGALGCGSANAGRPRPRAGMKRRGQGHQRRRARVRRTPSIQRGAN